MNILSRELHFAMGSIYESSSLLIVQLIPILAVASSVFFAFSPWKTIQQIRKAGSTGDYTFAPYYFYTVQCFLFLLYAYTTSNLMLYFTTGLGFVLGLYYMKSFYEFAQDKRTPEVLVAGAVFIGFALTYEAVARSTTEAQLIIGIAGNIMTILTAASPLAQVKVVFKNQDASCLPYEMSVMNAFAGFIWTVYGSLLEDILVIFPNFVTLVMGIFQLLLIYRFPSRKKFKLKESTSSVEVI